jgi:hypothetical protein
MEVGRDTAAFRQLAERHKLPRNLIAKCGVWHDDHDAAQLRTDEQRQHGFGLAGARRHNDGGCGIRRAPVCKNRVESSDLRPSETLAAGLLVFLRKLESV